MKKLIIFILVALTLVCFAEPPDFKQDDPLWADYIYSSYNNSKQTIKNNGCSLAAAADMIAYWFDENITPVDIAELSMKKFKSCAYEGGTSAYFYAALARYYPFSRYQETKYVDNAIKCLNDGGIVLVSFTSGIWMHGLSKGAHCCCAYSYSKEDGFRMHDPVAPAGLMSRIYGHVSYEKMARCAYKFYCYWR